MILTRPLECESLPPARPLPVIDPDSDAPLSEGTTLLRRSAGGDAAAGAALFESLYAELHRLAGGYLGGQGAEHTLQATALVHEAYLKLTGSDPTTWNDHQHFLATASRAMRQVLVDHARRKGRDKRRPDGQRVLLDELVEEAEERSRGLLAFDEALSQLAEVDPQAARVVELRFFVGLSVRETARVMELSGRRIERDWSFAKAWLKRTLA